MQLGMIVRKDKKKLYKPNLDHKAIQFKSHEVHSHQYHIQNINSKLYTVILTQETSTEV